MLAEAAAVASLIGALLALVVTVANSLPLRELPDERSRNAKAEQRGNARYSRGSSETSTELTVAATEADRGASSLSVARRLAQADTLPTRLGDRISYAVDVHDGEEFAHRIAHYPDELPDGGIFDKQRWERIVSAEEPNKVKHVCYRHRFDDDSTTYLSESIVQNTSPDQITRFYLADEERHHWDDTYHHSELLRTDATTGAEVVYYVRNFPVMCAPRDYVFSRRTFVKGDSYITVSKACAVPEKPPLDSRDVVRVDRYESSWRCRRVLGNDGESSATQVLLYHYEDQKLPQTIARMAVSHGMWPQVRKCFTSGLESYIQKGRDDSFAKSLRGIPRFESERNTQNEAPGTASDTDSDVSTDTHTQNGHQQQLREHERKRGHTQFRSPVSDLRKRKRLVKRALHVVGGAIGLGVAVKCGTCATVRSF
jgi:hypothetical protein